ncbi:MAG: hypothetical protein Q9216_004885 [Gyalolechia sp. 2 TL-2023]
MTTPTKVYFPAFSLKICAELYAPADGATDRQGAAIVISHPMTGVKEQTAANYARVFSQAGFYALAFDAGYQGESTGQPRGLEDPHQRVEDVKAAVSYLTILKGKVDPERIGVLGICASGGYTSYATQSDSRIKALGTVSAACVGRMTRGGSVHRENSQENPEVIAAALGAAAQWRNRVANNEHLQPPKMIDITTMSDDTDSFLKDAADYYQTPRGHHDRSDQRIPPVSSDLMISYDSFNFQHLISPRPLLMIHGSEAQTLHYSETAVKAAKDPKELFILKGKNHVDPYDDLSDTGPKLVDFFGKSLT